MPAPKPLRRLGASVDKFATNSTIPPSSGSDACDFTNVSRDFMQDLRYAARGLARRPAFTAVAVLTLAIGIGATTTIFSAVNVLLLRALPFARPDELMKLSLVTPPMATRKRTDDMVWSYPKFTVFRDAQQIVQRASPVHVATCVLTIGDVER